MNEFLSTLLQAVIIAAVPVCAAFIGKGVSAFAKYISAQTDNALAKKYLADAADAITTAVSLTNQTYVDALKKSDKFTKENQEEALSRAIKEAVGLMRHDTIAFLKEAYGDLNDYLVSKIEAEVRSQKKADPDSGATGTTSTVAPAESSNVAAVAAATAAATAATVAQNTIAQVAAAIDEMPADAPAEGGGDPAPEDAPPPPERQEFYFGLPEQKE